MRRVMITLGVVAALVSAGCLQKDTTSTIYLGADGRLEWVVIDRQVRSDESDAGKRWAEEQAFLDGVWAGRDRLTKAFAALGGTNVRTQVLRDRVPYDVRWSANFESLGRLFAPEFKRCGVPHRSELKTTGTVTTWALAVQVDPEPPAVAGCDEESPLDGISDALDHLEIVLESGAFTEVVGFTKVAADKVALDDISSETIKKNGGWVVLSLTWDRAARR